MANSSLNSPNSSFENEDTIKLNSLVVSSATSSAPFVLSDLLYHYEHPNAPFNPLPPPPISINPGHGHHQHHQASRDDFLLPNSTNYSIFSSQNAMASVTSFQDPQATASSSSHIFNLDSSHDILTEYQNADLMYNLTEFELGNQSLELLPDSTSSFTHSFADAGIAPAGLHNPDFFPYTPSVSEMYTPSFMDASATEDLRLPIPIVAKSTPSTAAHKIVKKASMSRLPTSNNPTPSKKASIISNQVIFSANNTPNSESSPQAAFGISPLCNKYKGMDIYQQPSPIGTRSFSNALTASNSSSTSITTPNKATMPPLNIFRHNSDSLCSSYYSTETPKRKTYPLLNDVLEQKAKKNLARKLSHQSESPQSPPLHLINKPKKYTRRRLLPRSKNGCWICRIKHLKCDEIRPVCTLCAKFGIDCDYLPAKPDYVADKNLRKEKLMAISLLRKQKAVVHKPSRSKLNSYVHE